MLRKISTVAAMAGVFTLGATYSAHAATGGAVAVRGVAADSVTGCLQKGSGTDTYSVKDRAGNQHPVMSAAVPLATHVGQEVTVVGTTSASGPMTVTSINMLRASCVPPGVRMH
jgi:hypothetical protein